VVSLLGANCNVVDTIHRNFRAYRLLAFSHILSMQSTGSPALRVKPDALLLSAACVWLINSLHSRPEDGPSWRSLMHAVLPNTDSDDVDDETFACVASGHGEREHEEEESDSEEEAPSQPYNPFGVIFLRRIVPDVEVPRMRAGGRNLTIPAFKYIFGAMPEDIRLKYHKVGIVPAAKVPETRIVTNKTKYTPSYINTSGADEPNLFSLAENGYSLPPPVVDGGSDIEEEDDLDEAAGDIDAEVSQMWRQFLVDVAMKTPNPRGATSASYFTVTRDDRLSTGEELYKNDNLSDMWRECQYKLGSRDDWKCAFGHMFPPVGHQTSQRVQNYTQCKYYLKWKEICSTADAKSALAIRKQLWNKVYSLAWIPHACQDKLWPTSKANGFTRLPPQSTGPAPRILVKRRPSWD
jgi:hypothetical protein